MFSEKTFNLAAAVQRKLFLTITVKDKAKTKEKKLSFEPG